MEEEPIQIFVRARAEKTFTLYPKPSALVSELADMIQDAERAIHPDSQRLIFANQQLEFSRRLSDYNIIDQSTLLLVLRPGPHSTSIADVVRSTWPQHNAQHVVLAEHTPLVIQCVSRGDREHNIDWVALAHNPDLANRCVVLRQARAALEGQPWFHDEKGCVMQGLVEVNEADRVPGVVMVQPENQVIQFLPQQALQGGVQYELVIYSEVPMLDVWWCAMIPSTMLVRFTMQ
eukprot:TRINITY_DN20109_c0_g1_i2.p1 TRINITY_DN20109_c0_g1~~TRINITY_DN20109_c0_g1_i2.p1  ORF type:complete len:233 (-),score=66.06 TRINITY_DN20109_c0_g1_i2:113-811(-)